MYWKNLSKSAKIIDLGHSFTTEDGECVDWNGQESWEAQSYLTNRAIKSNSELLIEKAFSMEIKEVLQACKIEGNIVKLPEGQLDRKLYQDVAKALTLIGGKWKGNKIMGFVFLEDPTELLAQIANGEKRNMKKEFQFFATPEGMADYLVELGMVRELSRHSKICEPQAGQGAIVKSIFKNKNIRQVDCCELMPINKTFLNKIDGVLFIADDFLTLPESFNNYYDRVIANPPFTKNQDIDHIYKMYDVLKSGGRMVSVASAHWEHSKNKKEVAFREWLDDKDAVIETIEPGAFKDSGTMVGGRIIVIDK